MDAHEFERLAGSDPASALELCRGDLLEGLEDDWAVAARDRHRTRMVELLEELARAASILRTAVRTADVRSGYVIVGSLPAPGGQASAAGAGALTVLNAHGRVVESFRGGEVNGAWDLTAVDSGRRARS